jgi:hypothetical protein
MKRIIFCLFVTAFLVACGGEDYTEEIKTEDAFTYKVIDINGMTCVRWNNGIYTGGLTCNWNEWDKIE